MIIFRFQAKDYDKRKFSALMICACFIDKLSKKDETHVYTSKLSQRPITSILTNTKLKKHLILCLMVIVVFIHYEMKSTETKSKFESCQHIR